MSIIPIPSTEDSYTLVGMGLKNPTLFPGPTNWFDVGRFRQGSVTVWMPSAVGSGINCTIWAQTTDDDPDHQHDDTLWTAYDLYHDLDMKIGENDTRRQKKNIVNGASVGSTPGAWVAVYKHLAARYLRLAVTYSGTFGGSDGFRWGARFVGK